MNRIRFNYKKITALLLIIIIAIINMIAFTSCTDLPGNEEGSGSDTVTTDANGSENNSEINNETSVSSEEASSEVPSEELSSEAMSSEQSTKEEVSSEEMPSESNTDTEELPTESPTETEVTTEKATEVEEATTKEEVTTEKPDEIVNVEKGVIITKVYGPGNKADATVGCGFIELYNTTSKTIDLNGMSLFYGEGKSFSKYDFKGVKMASGQYLLIKCAEVDDYDTSYEVIRVDKFDLEWGVSIDNKEFDLILAPRTSVFTPGEDYRERNDVHSYVRASVTPDVDIYSVDDLTKNKVIVRAQPDEEIGFHLLNLKNLGTEEIARALPQTSKGNVNTYISSRFTEVSFSKAGGVYGSAFGLTLSAPDGYTIYYTTDGSDPRTNGIRYNGNIQIRNTNDMYWGETINATINMFNIGYAPKVDTMFGGTVIKACAKKGSETTAVYTNTYFVSRDIADAKVPVMSLSLDVDDFVGYRNGAYYTYQFDLWATRPRSRAYLEFMDENGVKQGASYIEFAVSGNGSSGNVMKSLRLYFKDPLDENDPASDSLEYPIFGDWSQNIEGQTISTFERIIIRNAGNDFSWSYLRDAFCQRMAFGLNVDSMAYRPMLVFINGEFWGVYNCRERYSPEYVNQKYGVLEDNVAIIENESPLKYGSTPASFNTDYVSTAGDPNEAAQFNALVNYIKQHDLSDPEVYKYVSDRIDVDSFIDYWIVNTYFCNNDWPGNNIKVWRNIDPNDPSGMDTKWRFMLLDLDFCMSYVNVNTVTTNMFNDINNNTRCGAIMNGFMENEEFKLKFAKRAYELVEERFNSEQALDTFNSMVEAVDGIIDYQFERYNWGGDRATWESELDVIRDYLENRPQYYLQQVCDYTGYTESDISVTRKVTVSIDTDKVNVSVNGVDMTSDSRTFSFDNDVRLTISATPKDGYKVVAIAYIDNVGNLEKREGSSATFDVKYSGTVIVYTEAVESGSLPVSSGLYAGMTSTYYLDGDGRLFGWGDNRGSVLGIPTSVKYITSPVFIMNNVAKVDAAHGYDAAADGANTATLAILTRDGKLYTVGNNSHGQLGRSGDADELLPVDFHGKIVDVAVGYDHLLILDENGVVWGVGNNSRGQLGAENHGGNVNSFRQIATGVAKIAAGRRNSMYITENGDLYALGDNRWSKIRDGSADDITVPHKIAENIAEVWGSTHQMLILSGDGTLYYLGWRAFDTLVQGEDRWEMYKVCENVVEAEMYDYHIIMRCADGKVYGYGLNDNAQLGGQAGSDTLGEGSLKLLTDNAADIAAGSGTTAILKRDGTVVTVGKNDYGQAGNGTNGGNVGMTTVKFP